MYNRIFSIKAHLHKRQITRRCVFIRTVVAGDGDKMYSIIARLNTTFQVLLRSDVDIPASAAAGHQHRHPSSDAVRTVAAKDSGQRHDHPVGAGLRQTVRSRHDG